MPLPSFAASDDQRVIAGVCAGIAQALAVDVTLVRLVFTLLALAGGAGIVLYFALWVYGSKGKVWVTALLVLFAGSLLLGAVGLSNRSVLGIALVALVLIAAAIFASVVHVHLGRGVGDRTYFVSTEDLRDSYRLGIGDLRVDLSDVQLPSGTTDLKTSVDVGRLTVVVPPNVTLQVHGDADYGKVTLLGDSSDGHDVDRTIDGGKAARVLALNAHVGAGSLYVERAVR